MIHWACVFFLLFGFTQSLWAKDDGFTSPSADITSKVELKPESLPLEPSELPPFEGEDDAQRRNQPTDDNLDDILHLSPDGNQLLSLDPYLNDLIDLGHLGRSICDELLRPPRV